MRFLIYDNHDNHISGRFIHHYIQHDIVLILLSSHCSHLLQPLDVSIFDPLKSALSNELDHIFRTGISTLQKIEWFQAFMKARASVINVKNIQGGWRGTGIYQMHPTRVLKEFALSMSIDSSL